MMQPGRGVLGVSDTSGVAGGVPDPNWDADLALAAAVRRKDRKATAEFIERHADALHSYLRRRLSPRTDLADDLLQEVFLTAWESLARYEGRSSLRNWLLGIARHKVEDHYRAALREPWPCDESEAAGEPSGQAPAEERMDRERLLEKTRLALERLPERYRAVLRWRYWERRSAAEVAAQTGTTVKAVERLLARARLAFRKEWSGA